MKIQATFGAWVAEPAAIAILNENTSAAEIHQVTYLFLEGLNMTSCGYVKVGTAKVEYDLEIGTEEQITAAAKAITDKITQIEERAENEVAALREGLRRLQAITYEG